MEDILSKILPGLIIAIFASFLSTKWSLKKFYSEKWWERKSIAYSELIESLYEVLQFFEIHKKDFGQGTGLTTKQESNLQEKYNQAHLKIKKASDIGSFVVSKKTQLILKELFERPKLNRNQNPIFEIYEEKYEAHQNALELIVIEAKKDLCVK
ncbi:MAG: hypothetical protein ACQETL_19870 [Bacteroidota bacterium]